jgi:hypothetical protein
MIATRKDKGVLVRMKTPLIKQLDKAANKSGRSRNSEILVRLVDSFSQDKKAAKAA